MSFLCINSSKSVSAKTVDIGRRGEQRSNRASVVFGVILSWCGVLLLLGRKHLQEREIEAAYFFGLL